MRNRVGVIAPARVVTGVTAAGTQARHTAARGVVMPVLVLGLLALAVFLVMGVLLFSASLGEVRERERRNAAAAGEREEKARAAHA